MQGGSNNTVFHVLATIVIISIAAFGAIGFVVMERPNMDNSQLFIQIFGFAGTTLFALLAYLKSLSNGQAIADNTAVTIDASDKSTQAVHEAKEEVKQSVAEVRTDVGSAAEAAKTAAANAAEAATAAAITASVVADKPQLQTDSKKAV